MMKREMLECLINYYADGNKALFSRMLGVKPQTINTWLMRDSFDLELVYSKCEGVSGEWLLSGGKGDMIRTLHNTNESIDGSELISLCKNLVESYKQRDDVMNKLVSLFE